MSDKSLASLLEALSTAQTSTEKYTLALEAAKLLLEENDAPQAQRYAEQALQLASPAEQGEAHYQLGRIHFAQDEGEATIQHAEKAVEAFEQNGLQAEVGKCYNMLGAVYTNLSEPATALENFEKAIQWNENTQNFVQLGKVFTHLQIFVRLSMPAKNILLFYQNLYEDAPAERKAYIHHNIGVFYRQENQDEKALPEFEKALALKESQNLAYELGETLFQLGSILDLKGESRTAFQYHLRALQALLEAEKPQHIGIVMYYLAHAAQEAGNADMREEALAWIAKAQEKGFKLPEDTEESAEATDTQEEVIDLAFGSRLAEVAQLEKNLSAEELGKHYAETLDPEVGILWVKKLLSQYNHAWLGRKAKLQAFEAAKEKVTQDIQNHLSQTELSQEERATWETYLERLG